MIFYHCSLLHLQSLVLTVLRMVVCIAVDAEKLVVIEPQAWRSGRDFRDQADPSCFEFQIVVALGLGALTQTSQLKEMSWVFILFLFEICVQSPGITEFYHAQAIDRESHFLHFRRDLSWMHWMCLASGSMPSAVCMEQLILGAVHALLYLDLDSFMCARPLLSLAHAGGQERPACLCAYDKCSSCWVGHMLGWEILPERVSERTKPWEWGTEREGKNRKKRRYWQ